MPGDIAPWRRLARQADLRQERIQIDRERRAVIGVEPAIGLGLLLVAAGVLAVSLVDEGHVARDWRRRRRAPDRSAMPPQSITPEIAGIDERALHRRRRERPVVAQASGTRSGRPAGRDGARPTCRRSRIGAGGMSDAQREGLRRRQRDRPARRPAGTARSVDRDDRLAGAAVEHEDVAGLGRLDQRRDHRAAESAGRPAPVARERPCPTDRGGRSGTPTCSLPVALSSATMVLAKRSVVGGRLPPYWSTAPMPNGM